MEQLDTTNYFKSVKYILPLIAIMLGLTYCSPTETVTETTSEEEEVVSEDAFEPEWYDNRVTSRTDSVFFFGYSHSSASDSTEAIELAEEMAKINLKFQIDKFSDDRRELTAESTDSELYRSADFIVTLRNAVQKLELTTGEITVEVHQADNGVFHAFTEVKEEKGYIINNLSEALNDELFLEYLTE